MKRRAHQIALALSLMSQPIVAQSTPVPVTMSHLGLELGVDYRNRSLGGTATLRLRNVSSGAVGNVSLLLNRLMSASSLSNGEGRSLSFNQDVVVFSDDPSRQVTQVVVDLPTALPPGDSTTIVIRYGGVLTGYTETGSLYIRDRVDEHFTIIREDAYAFPVAASASIAALRSAPRVPFSFSASVRVPLGVTVAMGGTRGERTVADSVATWTYRSTAPVPFLNITIAPYRTSEGRGFRLFHFAEDSTGATIVSKAISGALGRLEQLYGPLPRTPDIAVMEIPEGFGSQASLTAGIILTADAFRDRAQLRQLYHELSHLWNVADLDSPSPRWNEGLATFLQYRLAADLDGWSEWDARLTASAQSLLRRCPADSPCASVPLAGYGQRGLTDYSYTTGFLLFSILYQTLGAASFDRVYRDFFQRNVATGASTEDLTRSFRAADPRSEQILQDWLFTTRWRSRLAGGESIAQILASYQRR